MATPPDAAGPAPALDGFLTYRLHRLTKLTDRQTAEAYTRELGLPAGEARCLAAVGHAAQRGPLSVKELAAQANLDKAQASRAAQALVARGLLAKTGSPQDGRGVVLALTPEGQARWQQAMALIDRRNRQILDCLQPAEQAQLLDLLDRLIAHARDA